MQSTGLIQGLSLPARMEAILYLKGRPLSLAELAEIAAVSREEAELGLITLITDYAHRDTALEVRQEGNRYSLQLRDGLADLAAQALFQLVGLALDACLTGRRGARRR